MMTTKEQIRLSVVDEVSEIATTLQGDVFGFAQRTSTEVSKYRAGTIELDELCFWHKSLVRAFLANVEGQCYAMRRLIATHAKKLGADIPERKLLELGAIERRDSVAKVVTLAFRYFPRLFELATPLDSSGQDFRGFKALVQARDRFTHPKTHMDICPFELFPSIRPAMEWFYLLWWSMLVGCISTYRSQLGDTKPPPVTTRFQDSALSPFQELQNSFSAERRRDDFIEQLRGVVFRLMADTTLAMKVLNESTDHQSTLRPGAAARCLVRTLFCEIEGTTHVAASHLHQYRPGYDPPSEALLIGSHAEVRERIALTMESFSREFGNAVQIPRRGSSWESFIAARGLRNRLTHPKAPQDPIIRPEELTTLCQAASWWHSDVHRCLELSGKKLPPTRRT